MKKWFLIILLLCVGCPDEEVTDFQIYWIGDVGIVEIETISGTRYIYASVDTYVINHVGTPIETTPSRRVTDMDLLNVMVHDFNYEWEDIGQHRCWELRDEGECGEIEAYLFWLIERPDLNSLGSEFEAYKSCEQSENVSIGVTEELVDSDWASGRAKDFFIRWHAKWASVYPHSYYW
jgi:hypothetical protein